MNNIFFCKIKFNKPTFKELLRNFFVFSVLVIGLLFSVSNFSTHAETITDLDGGNGFTYSIDTDKKTAELTKYSGSSTEVVIPTIFSYEGNDYNVKTIGTKAFYNNTSITTVTGNSIIKIETSVKEGGKDDGVFGSCTSLTSAVFPNCIEVGKHAFADCSNLQTINLDNAVFIASYVFRNCRNLGEIIDNRRTIEFPNATYLGDHVFYGVSEVQKILLPKTTYIGGKAFAGCNNLANVETPNLVYCDSGIFESLNTKLTFTAPEKIKHLPCLSNTSVTNKWVNNENYNPFIEGTVDDLNQFRNKVNAYSSQYKINYFQFQNNDNKTEYINFLGDGDDGENGIYYYPAEFESSTSSENYEHFVKLVKLNAISITVTNTEFTYDGSAKTPSVVITDRGNTLVENADYTISYDDNINAGNKTLTIIFLNNYANMSSKTYNFTISKADADQPIINFDKIYQYTGNPIQLILSISNANIFTKTNGPKLYLRIADNLGDLPNNDKPWVLYSDTNTLNNESLKRTNVGNYYIYYYIDGGTNYNDVSGTSD